MDRLVGVTKLEKDGKTYLLLSDGMWTHYIVDPENNKESYQLNGCLLYTSPSPRD